MLFQSFASQAERRAYGGSAFLEIQFCRLPAGTPVREIVKWDNIRHWQDDSLYIDDENAFFRKYSSIFQDGTYSNLKHGVVDIYGINYYAPTSIDAIIGQLQQNMPEDHEALLKWLVQAQQYNGVYILGL